MTNPDVQSEFDLEALTPEEVHNMDIAEFPEDLLAEVADKSASQRTPNEEIVYIKGMAAFLTASAKGPKKAMPISRTEQGGPSGLGLERGGK